MDSVRDSFREDTTSTLALAESAALAATTAVGRCDDAVLADALPLFEQLSHRFHAMCGTSSLLGIRSLALLARQLELLADFGQTASREIQGLLAAVRAAGQLSIEGVAALRDAVDRELSGDGDTAFGRTKELTTRVRAFVGSVALPECAASIALLKEAVIAAEAAEPSFSFNGQPEDSVPSAQGGGDEASEFSFGGSDQAQNDELDLANDPKLKKELMEIFAKETKESVVSLQAYLGTIRRNPADASALKSLERIYHTLKGTSATVGLMEVSSLASDLQDRIERVLDREMTLDAAGVESLLLDTNAVLRKCDLPEVRFGTGATDSVQLSDELRRVFLDESREICAQASSLLTTFSDARAPAGARSGARASLAALFHRLKGSAVLHSLERVASIAGELQRLFDSRSLQEAGVERSLKLYGELKSSLDEMGMPAAAQRTTEPARSEKLRRRATVAQPMAESLRGGSVREPVKVNDIPALWEAFETEAVELLDSIQKSLFSLEESDAPKTVISELFRAFHTLKGAANTAGLNPVGKVVHRVEDLLSDLMEASILPPLKSLTTFLLKASEGVRTNIAEARKGYVVSHLSRLESEIARLRSGHDVSSLEESEVAQSASGASSLESQHSSAGSDRAEGTSSSTSNKFIRVSAQRLDGLMNLAGELVVSRSRLSRRVGTLRTLQRDLIGSRGRLLRTVEDFCEKYEFAGLEGRRRRMLVSSASADSTFARVDRPRRGGSGLESNFTSLELDHYEDINILARSLREVNDDLSEVQKLIGGALDQFGEDSDDFSAIITRLQTEITTARMIPIDQLFMRLQWPVRDAAERERKDVRVVTVGEDVNLDKTIIDSLYLPMLHLVRNSVSHGVEASNVRSDSGKDRSGTITLSARQASGQIVIEVTDDGAGLDLEALRSKGLAMGAIPAGLPIDHPSIRDLVFVEGLSTRDSAGDVAGRGVGCYAVRRDIEKLNGSIRVESTSGRGTTYTITLPLTLSITKALLVKARGSIFALPLHFSERILEIASSKIVESAGVRRIEVGGSYISLRSLHETLKLRAPKEGSDGKGVALLLRVGEERVAIEVDSVIGQEEIVVKTLGDLLVGHSLFSGVTISGTGELILIVDVPGLLGTVRGTSVEHGVATIEASQTGSSDFAQGSGAVRALFVDDSLSVRKVAESFLAALGVEVELAVDGLDGLAKLRQGRFDIVFTDIEMPRMHGYEFLREMRYVPAYKEIPAVVVTSRSGQKHRTQAELAGATDYVTKPFTQGILQEKLEAYVKRFART